jgi:hypothetical protein
MWISEKGKIIAMYNTTHYIAPVIVFAGKQEHEEETWQS